MKDDVDPDKFTKLYLPAENWKVLQQFRQDGSWRVFLWIAYHLKDSSDYERDMVRLDLADCGAVVGIKRDTTFSAVIRELESLKIIQRVGKKRSVDYWNFWVNPIFFFRGKRFDYYREQAIVTGDNVDDFASLLPKKRPKGKGGARPRKGKKP